MLAGEEAGEERLEEQFYSRAGYFMLWLSQLTGHPEFMESAVDLT